MSSTSINKHIAFCWSEILRARLLIDITTPPPPIWAGNPTMRRELQIVGGADDKYSEDVTLLYY